MTNREIIQEAVEMLAYHSVVMIIECSTIKIIHKGFTLKAAPGVVKEYNGIRFNISHAEPETREELEVGILEVVKQQFAKEVAQEFISRLNL